MILKSLFRRKVRSLLTVLGIAVGIAAIVALGAIADGFVVAYSSMAGQSSADLVVSQSGAAKLPLSTVDDAVGAEIKAMPGVKAVAPVLNGFIPTAESPLFIIFGEETSSFAIEHFRVIEGQKLAADESGARRKDMLLGKLAAQSMKKRVGDTMCLGTSVFRIAGIFETGVGYEEGGAVISLLQAQTLLNMPHKATLYSIQLKPGADPAEVRAQIARRHTDLAVAATTDFAETQQDIQMMRGLAWGLSLLAVLVGGLGMMNAILMSVLERTWEIGVLRAVGWTRGRVLGLIMGESVLLSLAGGAVGIGLGVLLVTAAGKNPAAGGMLQGRFSPALFIQAVAVAVLLGAVGGLYPAWRAASLQPVEAMRYEGGSGGDAPPRFLPGGLALRELFRRRSRTLLTIVGISVGIATIVAIDGMISDFYRSFMAQMAEGSNLMVSQRDVSNSYLSSLDERTGQRIAALPGVRNVSGVIYSITTSKDTGFSLVFGYQPQEAAIQRFKVVAGRSLAGTHEVIVGRVAAEQADLSVGSTTQLMGSNFRVVGIYETGSSLEDHSMVVSLREAQTLSGKPRRVTFYAVQLERPDQAEALRAVIERENPDVTVSLASRFSSDRPEMALMLGMVNGLGMVAWLLGGIIIMNTMVMAIFERTREIGTLRALGWRARRVLGVVLAEALALSLASALAGIVLGVGLVRLLMLTDMGASFLQGKFDPALFQRTVVIALVIGALSGLYPAWRATRLSPVEALRYE